MLANRFLNEGSTNRHWNESVDVYFVLQRSFTCSVVIWSHLVFSCSHFCSTEAEGVQRTANPHQQEPGQPASSSSKPAGKERLRQRKCSSHFLLISKVSLKVFRTSRTRDRRSSEEFSHQQLFNTLHLLCFIRSNTEKRLKFCSLWILRVLHSLMLFSVTHFTEFTMLSLNK